MIPSLSRLICHVFILSFLMMAACGENIPEESTTEGASLIIGDLTWLTTQATLGVGETLTIINQDDVPHTLTSQSALGAYDNTGDFDVLIPSEGVATLTLPNALPGETYFFYCRYYLESMGTGGSFTIE